MENPVNPEIEFLKDVKLRFNVHVGSVQKMLIEILSLQEGDVIELDKNIEEYVNCLLYTSPSPRD